MPCPRWYTFPTCGLASSVACICLDSCSTLRDDRSSSDPTGRSLPPHPKGGRRTASLAQHRVAPLCNAAPSGKCVWKEEHQDYMSALPWCSLALKGTCGTFLAVPMRVVLLSSERDQRCREMSYSIEDSAYYKAATRARDGSVVKYTGCFSRGPS